jgi:hypothetical protein
VASVGVGRIIEPMDPVTIGAHAARELAFEGFGVPVTVRAPSPEILARIEPILPPGWRRRDGDETDAVVQIRCDDGVNFLVEHPGGLVAGSSDVGIAIEVLDAKLRLYVAEHATRYVFVHAGVVGHHGRAIVMPGFSFSGKTTLVAELVRAGATYYSDEYAVLDEAGRVHPYAKPLSIRTEGRSATDHSVETIGGVSGDQPLPVGLVVAAVYHPDARWEPRRLSAAEGIMAMFANTIPAQDRPEQCLKALKQAARDAVVLEGERGEASEVARQLLSSVPG